MVTGTQRRSVIFTVISKTGVDGQTSLSPPIAASGVFFPSLLFSSAAQVLRVCVGEENISGP